MSSLPFHAGTLKGKAAAPFLRQIVHIALQHGERRKELGVTPKHKHHTRNTEIPFAYLPESTV